MVSPLRFGRVPEKVWDSLVVSSNQGTVFNSRDFLNGTLTPHDFWGVFQEDCLQVAIAVPAFDGVFLGQSDTFDYCQGLIFSRSVLDLEPHSRVRKTLLTLSALIKELTSLYPQFWFSLHSSFPDVRAFQWHNFNDHTHGRFDIRLRYTGKLALDEVKDRAHIVRRAARGRQSDYRKALSKGFTVTTCPDTDILESLHQQTFQRQRADRGYYDKALTPIAKNVLRLGLGELLVAWSPHGVPVSATLFLWDRSTAYYLFGASSPEFRNSGAMTLVMIESLWRAASRGLSFIDFVGVNSPQRGEFKTSFGAEIVPYFELSWPAIPTV